jgi:hypothetical protein
MKPLQIISAIALIVLMSCQPNGTKHNYSSDSYDTQFTNNIFYFEDEAEWIFDPDSNCVLKNNAFYNISPKGSGAITADPMFVNPGESKKDIDMTNPNRLSDYRLKAGSPALNAGLKIENNGGKNFGGVKLNNDAINIGAW